MTRTRVVLLALLSLLFCSSWCLKSGPCREEQLIATFHGYGGAGGLTATQCSYYSYPLDAPCSNTASKLYVDSAWQVTAIRAMVTFYPFNATDGCDLLILHNIAGTLGIAHPGAVGLRTVGQTVSVPIIVTSFNAGGYLQVSHINPVDTSQCETGGGLCVCTTDYAGYTVEIWGRRNN